jgi:carbonic anhydrase/acetyltransferase-like protein (isoleucine patch superfamily)
VIGEDCNICDHTFIENDVIVGDRVTIKCGVQLWDGVRLEDDVFIGPNVTFTNDPFPRSKQHPEIFKTIIVSQGASIGANATILPGITIGRYAMVGAGAVVTMDVPPYAIVVGNPAVITGYDSKGYKPTYERRITEPGLKNLELSGVRVIELTNVNDLRGNLSVTEFERDLPFSPKRVFWIYNVPSREIRGEHAHHSTHLFVVCVKGSCVAVVDDGVNHAEVVLDRPNLGLYIPPLIWGTQHKYSPDALLVVFASEPYNAGDYIRDYEDFLQLKKQE